MLDLKKLEEKLDKALSLETKESKLSLLKGKRREVSKIKTFKNSNMSEEIFKNIGVKCSPIQGNKSVIVVPQQGLNCTYVTIPLKTLEGLKLESYYRVDLKKDPNENRYISVSEPIEIKGIPTLKELLEQQTHQIIK
jgi:hypothetical protein